MNIDKLLITFAFALVVFAPRAFAQNSGSAKVGGLFGYSVPDAENVNPYIMYGMTGSASLAPTFSIGGYYLVANKAQGSGARKFEHSVHGVQALYQIAGGEGETFVGLRAGLSKLRTDDSGNKVIFSPYHYGLVGGHDYRIASWMSLGFEGSFLIFRKSTTTSAGTQIAEPKFKSISFLLSLKFHF